MYRPLLSLNPINNDPFWHGENDRHSAAIINGLIQEGFEYPKMFEINYINIVNVLKHIKKVSFNSSQVFSGIPEENAPYTIIIGFNWGIKERMVDALIHEIIHIYLEQILGLPINTKKHWFLEKEIEAATINFINQNRAFCEILINNLELYCHVEVINKPPNDEEQIMWENSFLYWKILPDFLNKYAGMEH